MADEGTRSARRAQRALRDIRLESDRTWRTWPRRSAAAVWSAVVRLLHTIAGFLRAIAEFIAEIFLELIPAILALLIFALVSAAAVWGWQRSAAATVVFVAGFVAFAAFGAHELWFRRKGRRRGRIAALAAGTCVFVAVWVAYLVPYLPT